MLKNLKHLKSMALVALLVVLLPSCQDGRIAKQADGRWHYGYTTTFEDGSKTETDVYLSLSKDSDSYGGKFIESTVSAIEYYDDDGSEYNVPYCTFIMGTWEIIAGNLFKQYDISSLEVNAYQDSIKVSSYEDALAIAYVSQLFSSTNAGFSYYRGKVATAFNEEMYTEMFHYYSYENECDVPYGDVEATGSTLSFESEDLGRVVCERFEGAMPGIEFLINE